VPRIASLLAFTAAIGAGNPYNEQRDFWLKAVAVVVTHAAMKATLGMHRLVGTS